MTEKLDCRVCGGELQEDGRTYICSCCGHTFVKNTEDDFAEKIKDLLKEEKYEKVSAARQNLWSAMHEEYVSSSSCLEYARGLKSLVPSDYYANFAETANGKSERGISRFLNSSSDDDMRTYADAVLDFMLKSLTHGVLTAVRSYIERAFSKASPEYARYVNLYEKEAEKVESGIYELTMPRDVFVAYSSKDIDKVLELTDYLEEQGISCFISMRNLRHGRGAADNYDEALQTAIDNCKTVVFISSKNSRSLACDALRKEIHYIRKTDTDGAPAEYRAVAYEKIPYRYKKDRVEYLLDDYANTAADTIVKEFFDGVEWSLTKEDVAERIAAYLAAGPDFGAPSESFGAGSDEGRGDLVASFEKRKEKSMAKAGRLIAEGMFKQADAILDAVEGEERELFWGDLSAGVCFLKILTGFEARNADELVEKLAASGADIRGSEYFGLAVASEESSERAVVLGIPPKVESVLAERREEKKKKKTEERKEAEEEFRVAEDIFHGSGAEENMNAAAGHYMRAATLGHAEAQSRLGDLYRDGMGVGKDFAEAAKWYERAAEMGMVDAQFALGTLYYEGLGVEKDFAEAARWYERAAESGHAEAQNNFGVCLEYGFGVGEDPVEATKWYRKSAERGCADAQCNLGLCYGKGTGIKKDPVEAVRWFSEAAKQGNADAQCNLGWCYASGEGVMKDPVEAVGWFVKSAERGNSDAQRNLGRCYAEGEGVEKDPAEAVKWYAMSAKSGNADAQCSLGNCYYVGLGVARDLAEAVKWYRLSAGRENATAQYNLGVCLEQGLGTARDPVEAAKWFGMSADRGNAAAQCALGLSFAKGNGVAKNYKEAAKWFRKSAEQGNADAQCNLGNCLRDGLGTGQDIFEAAKWFRKSAEQGNTDAQCSLGNCYFDGRGVQKDCSEAVKWYRLSAEKGNAEAQGNLGNCYYKGLTVKRDFSEAVKWYRMSAEKGNPYSQLKLGDCYRDGKGVEEDLSEAEKWYEKSAGQGNANARLSLKKIRGK